MSTNTATASIPSQNGGKRSFRDAVLEGLEEEKNSFKKLRCGENGCVEFTNFGVGSTILAISQMVRGGNPDQLVCEILEKGETNEIVDLIVLLFATRNSRGGKGEKLLSYRLFLQVWNYFPQTAKELLKLFPHYGYWKDLFLLMQVAKTSTRTNPTVSQDLQDEALKLILDQFQTDVSALTQYQQKEIAKESKSSSFTSCCKGPKLSLLAKWMPRERSSLDKQLNFVETFAKAFYGSDVVADSSSSSSSSSSIASSPSLLSSTSSAKVASVEKKISPKGKSIEKTHQWQSSFKTKYRKQISELTKFLDLPEVLLSARRADEIKLEKVASKATKLLTRTFLNENRLIPPPMVEPKREKLRELFLDHIGLKGLKGGQVMPHEIVKTILENPSGISPGMEKALDAQWKDLWKQVVEQCKAKAKDDGIDFDPTKMVPLCDVSGSMDGTPIDVCIALGIGISEITHDAFKDLVLTFSANPTWHKLNPTDTIVQKVRDLEKADWDQNTNFAKAYDRILDLCLKHKLQRSDVPTLIVFSDMQFDEANDDSGDNYKYYYNNYDYYNSEEYQSKAKFRSETMFEKIRQRFKSVADTLGWDNAEPTPIVFWNLRNTNGHPVDKDTEGTVLLSGFSPSLLKHVMTGEAIKEEKVELLQVDGSVKTEYIRPTPEQLLRKMLDDKLYDPVRVVLYKSKEGALRDYEAVSNELEGESEIL